MKLPKDFFGSPETFMAAALAAGYKPPTFEKVSAKSAYNLNLEYCDLVFDLCFDSIDWFYHGEEEGRAEEEVEITGLNNFTAWLHNSETGICSKVNLPPLLQALEQLAIEQNEGKWEQKRIEDALDNF